MALPLNEHLPCAVNGLGRLTTMLSMTSVVKHLMEAAHLARVSVVVPHARGATVAARYANGRYAAVRVRGNTSHGAACMMK